MKKTGRGKYTDQTGKNKRTEKPEAVKESEQMEEKILAAYLEDGFPKMPDEIRILTEDIVWQQMETHGGLVQSFRRDSNSIAMADKDFVYERRRGRRQFRPLRIAVAAFAATFALGATVLAGAKIYQMYTERVGRYGEKIVVENVGDTEEPQAAKYTDATVKAGYLPEGMVQMPESLMYCSEENPWQGGFSLVLWELDTEETFELIEKNIVEKEMLTIGEHDAVYLKRNDVEPESDAVRFDHIMYVAYPEARLLVQIYVGEDMSREETIKFAEGLKLVEYENGDSPQTQKTLWSQYLLHLRGEQAEWTTKRKTQGASEALAEAGNIGTPLKLRSAKTSGMTATVKEVQVFDDLSALDPQYVSERLQGQTGAEGKLLPNEIWFIKRGDGVDTLDEVIDTQTAEQRLVYVTVEYKNNAEQPEYDYCFYPIIELLRDDSGSVSYYSRTEEAGADTIRQSGAAGIQSAEMVYYDVRSQEERNGSNYLDVLEAGESVTVHFGFLVNEDELPYMYLRLDNTGMMFEFSKDQLRDCVDIRQ